MSQENVEIARRWLESASALPREVEPIEYIDAGDAVLLICRIQTEVKGTVHTLRHGSVFQVRHGKVVDWQPYPKEEAAREAVGLSEQDAHADS
jgi:hypothetical protein